ncbi:hypothetical protein AA626_002389 [Enterobacter hormaechei]|uniref:hypothetical protein n=1 Tax=Enterobacter sp. BIDMC87 TaxID=1686395 RepID=UPI0006584284|nr:hypothetical protein [Enterobacter sp. BIDMC87]EHF4963739.1 hypothetical protein [Enterobacter hormaechei]EHF4977119.1 hypothetical protein [Enterobacter hormaechei]EHF4987230.1 hypothetical protein [Enterobacter hormaechei]EHF5050771.1 hypothetical protein [Enterobacter hormaechei]EKT9354066.1 hypothetical protein [Enterobacter hormaechei]
MITFTKEQLIASAHARIEFAEMMLAGELEPLKERTWSIELELARIALASLEAKPVSVNDDMAYAFHHAISDSSLGSDEVEEIKTGLRAAFANVTAPPAPASVPEWTNEQCLEFLSIAFRHAEIKGDLELDDIRLGVKMVNGSRAAMLQGADRPQNEPQNIPENIPATQFKPVADLYGLTSPTGGETSFTFDAVEARDFIDGGWSCQEYVELGRYQEALTDHSEDKLAMVDHSGDSNNMVEPVTTACKLRDAVDTIRNSGIAIDGEKILAERDALNSPVIPDGWVMVPEEPTHEMLEAGDEQFGTYDVYRRMIEAAPKLE